MMDDETPSRSARNLTSSQAIDDALEAQERVKEALPKAVRMMRDLRQKTLDLADVMEEYANQLKRASEELG